MSQYKLRCALKEQDETLPNQINKAIQTPMLRWILQIMEGVSVVYLYEKLMHETVDKLVANLNELRIKIIKLFEIAAQKIYGIT